MFWLNFPFLYFVRDQDSASEMSACKSYGLSVGLISFTTAVPASFLAVISID